MTYGRPPSWNPFAELEPSAWTEVVQLGTKGRLSIPAAARRRVGWLSHAAEEGLLATLEVDGSASLEPWKGGGTGALGRVTALLEATGPGERGWLALAAKDRYMHVSLEDNGRLAIPANLVAHLDPGGSGLVRVVVYDGYLKLWSEECWRAGRADRSGILGIGASPRDRTAQGEQPG